MDADEVWAAGIVVAVRYLMTNDFGTKSGAAWLTGPLVAMDGRGVTLLVTEENHKQRVRLIPWHRVLHVDRVDT